MRQGPRHSRRHRHPTSQRAQRTQPQNGPKGTRDPRQTPIPTTGPTMSVGAWSNHGGRWKVLKAGRSRLLATAMTSLFHSWSPDFGLRDGTGTKGLCRDAGTGAATRRSHEGGRVEPRAVQQLPTSSTWFRSAPGGLQPRGRFLGGEPPRDRPDLPHRPRPRGLIVSPPKAGRRRCSSTSAKPSAPTIPAHLILLLIDERPEEVTHFRRAVPAEVRPAPPTPLPTPTSSLRAWPSSGETARRAGAPRGDPPRLAHRLGRASNREIGPGGRTMCGGVDDRALQFPRYSSGRRATARLGQPHHHRHRPRGHGQPHGRSHLPGVQGHGNMELILDRAIADRRIPRSTC